MAHVLGSLCSPDCLLIIVCSATKVNRFAQILRNCLFADRLCSALSSCVFFHAPPSLLFPSFFAVFMPPLSGDVLCVLSFRARCSASVPLFFAVCPPFCSALSSCVFFHAPPSASASLVFLPPARCRCSVLFSASVSPCLALRLSFFVVFMPPLSGDVLCVLSFRARCSASVPLFFAVCVPSLLGAILRE